MKQKKFSRRLSAILIVIIILLIALFSVNYFASHYASQKVEAAFSKSKVYKLQFENLHVNVFTGGISVANVRVTPASSLPADTFQQVNFSAKSIRFSGVRWYPLLFNKKICISGIQIQQPVIAIKNFKSVQKKDAAKKHFDLYDLIQPKYESVRIKKFEVNDGEVSAAEKDSSNFFLATKSFNFKLYELVADSATARAGKTFEISGATASLKNIHGNFTKGLYHLSIPSFTLSTEGSEMNIDSLIFSPTVAKTLFAKKLGYQVAVRDIMIAGVHVNSGNLIHLIEQQEVLLDTIDVGYMRVNNYKDRNLPRKFTRYVLHHTFLDSLHFKIDIRKIKVNNGRVNYELLNVGATQPGRIGFDHLKFTLSGLSNINMNDTMKVDLSGLGMSRALFTLHMLLPLAKDEFYADGTMGPHDMTIWNPILINYKTPAEVIRGNAKSNTFSFTANTTKGTGVMTFIYSGLKIRTVNRQHQSSGMKNSVKTFVANKMVIKGDNPDDNVLRIGRIDFARNEGRNFISYVYHMIFNGMESSVGLREALMEKKVK